MVRVALGEAFRGCASPATKAFEMVLLGNSAKTASMAMLNSVQFW
jgi:hypothetical protein